MLFSSSFLLKSFYLIFAYMWNCICELHVISYPFLSVHISYIFIYWAIKWNAFCRTCIVSIENMGDQLDARIGVVRRIQEKFGHDVWKIEEWLTRSTKLDEWHIKVEIIYPRGLHLCLFIPPFTLSHITFIQITNQVSRPWATFLRELTTPTTSIPSV